MRTKILITGGYGFIGTNLINQLDNSKYEIAVIDNRSHGSPTTDIHDKCEHIWEIDIRDVPLLNLAIESFKPDITFHFAGLVSIYDCHKYPRKAVSNNIVGSANVFDALINAGCPRVVFAETSAVYEDSTLGVGGFAEHQSDPRTMYASTKAAVATLAESYAKTRGLKYTALRYFNVAGPIQDYKRTVPPLFAGVALRLLGGNNPIIFGDGNRRRDFIHVDDVNVFHQMCIDTGDINTVHGASHDDLTGTFNLGTATSYSLFGICDIIFQYLKSEGHLAEDAVLEFDSKDEIAGEAFEIYADISTAYRAARWSPKCTVKDAIIDTVDFLLKEVKAGNVDPKTFMVDLNTDEVKI
jgi:UDP-glucose 4-epimerase